LQEIKTGDQHCYKFLLIQQNKFFYTQCKLIINNKEIIACTLERDQRRKGEINCNCVTNPDWQADEYLFAEKEIELIQDGAQIKRRTSITTVQVQFLSFVTFLLFLIGHYL